MTVFSRFLEAAGFTTVYTPCYELTHPWNESCIGAMADVVPRSLIFSMKTYLTFYVLAYGLKLARGRKIKIDQIIKDTLRSMAFLTSNMCLFLYASCLLRQFFGCYFWSSYYIAGVIGSYFSILQESKKRRPVLALYLTNLASESLFYQLRNRGYVSNIPHGIPLLFVVGLGLLFYFKAYGIKSDMHGILSFTHSLEGDEKIKILNRLPEGIQNVIRRIREKHSKSQHCHHQHSCVSNILESSLVNFNKGLAVSVVLTALRSLSYPRNFFKNLFTTKTLAIPTFSALLPGIYHTVHCGLKRYSRLSQGTIMTIAGASSGAAMLAWPNLTIAMYILWKAIGNIYDHLADKGYLPRFKNGDVLLYSIVTGYIVGNCVVEPHALRPGYYFGFIRGLTLNQTFIDLTMNSNKSKSKSKSSAAQEKNQPSSVPSLSSDFPGLLQIEALMKDAGVPEWDQGVSFQVHDMAVQMIKSIIKNAEAIKEHREGKAVDDEDLDVAIESFQDSFTTPPVIDGSDPLLNNVQIVNGKALPPVRTDYGYHLPTERFLQVQPDFEVNDDVYEESLKSALASSYETSFPPPPTKRPHMDTTVQQVQHVQRTVQRAPPSESSGTFRITLSAGPSTASAAPSGFSGAPQNQQYVQIESQVHHEAVSTEMEGRLVQQTLSETEETTMLSAFQSESQQNNDFD